MMLIYVNEGERMLFTDALKRISRVEGWLIALVGVNLIQATPTVVNLLAGGI